VAPEKTRVTILGKTQMMCQVTNCEHPARYMFRNAGVLWAYCAYHAQEAGRKLCVELPKSPDLAKSLADCLPASDSALA